MDLNEKSAVSPAPLEAFSGVWIPEFPSNGVVSDMMNSEKIMKKRIADKLILGKLDKLQS